MRFRELAPVLWTNQLKETTDFYTDVLGFKLDNINEEYGWAHVSHDGISIMFSKPNEKIMPFDKAHFTGCLYIYINQIDQLWDSIKDKTEVCKPIKSYEYGMREFIIYDNNGYMLQFGQEYDA